MNVTTAYGMLEAEGALAHRWLKSNANSGTVSKGTDSTHVEGVANVAFHRGMWIHEGADSVIYVRVKAAHVTGQSTYFSFRDSGNAYRISVNLGFSYVSNAQILGKIGLIANGGAVKFDIASSFDYSEYVLLAFHVDTNRNAVSVYLKDPATEKWTFINAISGVSIGTITRFAMGVGSPSASSEIDVNLAAVLEPEAMAFGDSICAGRTLFDPSPGVIPGVDNGMSQWMPHAVGLFETLILNKGVGGNTSAGLLARVAEVTAARPEYVFLHLSSNDEQASVSQATRLSTTQSIVNALRAGGVQHLFVLNGIYANSNYAGHPGHAAYMQDSWENYIPGLTGVDQFLDIMEPLKDSNGVLDPGIAQADGIHPTVAGYQLIGEYIASVLA